MATEIVGTCFVCKKEIRKHDLTYKEEGHRYPAAVQCTSWPGSGIACTEHPGVIEQYEKEQKKSK